MTPTPTSIVAYLALFTAVGFLFIFATLLAGSLLRAREPRPEKLQIYECGEPTIGSGFVQFDLRFYVVALLFIVFDVEASFFFPWAVVFGKATQLSDPQRAPVVAAEHSSGSLVLLSPPAKEALSDLGVRHPAVPAPSGDAASNSRAIQATGRRLALTAMVDMAVFFAILLVGFAYVWKKGDLDWVRAVTRPVEVSEAIARLASESAR